MYTLVVIFCTSILILAYLTTLYRTCKGKSFGFITFLIIMLILSNAGYMVNAIYDHKAAYLAGKIIDNPEDLTYVDNYIKILKFQTIFILFRDVCFNEAIWLFSFRYWTISFVIPWQLRSEPVSKSYRVITFIILITGILLNFFIPFTYAYCYFRLNNSLDKSYDRIVEVHDKFQNAY